MPLGNNELGWDEELLLSVHTFHFSYRVIEQRSRESGRSSVISFKVYASFELGSMLGIGELLLQVEITVRELLKRYQRDQCER